eukprot:5789346-Amphidinium_carterae.1
MPRAFAAADSGRVGVLDQSSWLLTSLVVPPARPPPKKVPPAIGVMDFTNGSLVSQRLCMNNHGYPMNNALSSVLSQKTHEIAESEPSKTLEWPTSARSFSVQKAVSRAKVTKTASGDRNADKCCFVSCVLADQLKGRRVECHNMCRACESCLQLWCLIKV